MAERRAVGQGHADLVESAGAAETERLGLGRRLGRERAPVVVPGASRAAPEPGLLQRNARDPGEVGRDGVVVRQHVAVGLEELGALVGPVRRLEAHQGPAAVEDLVDRLALVGRARVVAEVLDRRRDAAEDQLHLRVREPRLRDERGHDVRHARVPAVGVAEHDDRVADAPGVDVVRHLLEVRRARREIVGLGPGVRVQVIGVDEHAVSELHAHERKPLGRQAVRFRGVAARVPLDARVLEPVVVGQTVQPGSEGYTP